MKNFLLLLVCFVLSTLSYGQINGTTNGLSTSGTNAKLGGTLIEATSIDVGSYRLDVKKGTSNYLSIFNSGNVSIGSNVDNGYKFSVHGISQFFDHIGMNPVPGNTGYSKSIYLARLDEISSVQQSATISMVPGSSPVGLREGLSLKYDNNELMLAQNMIYVPKGRFMSSTSDAGFTYDMWCQNGNGFLIKNNYTQWAGGYIFQIWGTNVYVGVTGTTGNFLIGNNTDNGNKLQVNGTIYGTGLKISTGAAAGKVLTSDADGVATWQSSGSAGWAFGGNAVGLLRSIGTTDNYALPFITNNTEKARILSNGNILIGTLTDNGEKMQVNGTIRSKKVVVTQNNWPDYVFDPNYSLMPLKDLRNYIRKERHLPDVNSSDEVEENGVDLGNNQSVLLKKIEELTLYILKQEEEIENLKVRLQKVEKKK